MHRYLLILLALILPLQFSWAVGSRYCQHETGAESWHFGHHEHHHQATKATASLEKKLGLDTDCSYCHLASQPSAFGIQPANAESQHFAFPEDNFELLFTSLSLPAPDRPQWQRLA
ncbi:cation efflux protein, CzcI family [Cupriavidus metallidurans]|uniref:Cobalt-zinc-cadmium resistance protein n=1 Tax=Cupriavidus metallidurans TaxID=119219 RepID=A0A482IYT3_9BURK|nr:cation efflux protein, CzcI family [Cupriavidus metallidurans]QBP12547.1 cobalt-zinc-cadmium resistance protein [Cupriavidus metallidurans]